MPGARQCGLMLHSVAFRRVDRYCSLAGLIATRLAVSCERLRKTIKKGAPMLYVYNVLAAILIGLSIGAAVGQRNNAALVTGLIAVVLGAITFFMGSWIPLAVGTAIFLLGQGM